MSKSRLKSSRHVAVSRSCELEVTKQPSGGYVGWLLRSFIFFAFFYFYFWLYVDLKLIYHGAGMITNFPVFYKGRAFLATFLSYPGGPVEYLSAFLSQHFYYSWAGALVVTVQAWLLSVCIDYLLKTVKLPRVRLVCFFPPILLLVIYARYAFHFPTTMALLVVLLFVCLYLKATLSQTKTLRYLGTFMILSVILYYLAGGAFLVFAAICAIYELVFRYRWKICLLYLVSAAAVPYILGLFVFRVSILDAFCNCLPFSWKILKYGPRKRAISIVYVLYLFPPLILLALGLLRMLGKKLHFVRKRTEKKHRNKSSNPLLKIFSWYRNSLKIKWAVGSLFLFAIAGSVVFFSRDEKLRIRFKVDYCACHKMWTDLLTCARQYPTDPFIVHAVNRALYHQGRLGYDMFSWPQHKDYLFLSDPKYKWVEWQAIDIYLDIGLINIAENFLTDALEAIGEQPIVLQRLALINMVKGNLDSARIYLGALSKTLFHTEWANKYLELIRNDPELSTDENIQHLRSLCLDKDCLTHSLFNERTLSWLLERNSRNRMAFEYLMAWYMLNKNLGKFARNLERLQDFNYRELPTNYEEAALIYSYGTGKSLNLNGYLSSPQKRQEIEEFSRILNGYSGNKNAASGQLAKKFGRTYFFYFIYAPLDPNN